jgi:hypothetical protein
MLWTILIVILILLFGALPTWPYSSGLGLLSRRRHRSHSDHRRSIGLNGPGLATLTHKFRKEKRSKQRGCSWSAFPAFAPRERPAAAQAC